MLVLHGGEGFVGRARNNICSKFLETDFTHLLMLDSDILCTKEDVDRISSHEDVPVVAGFYPKRGGNNTVWVANHLTPNEPVDERGLVKLATIGTGFMMIQREVLEKMRDSGLAARYVVDGTDIVEYEFFPFRVVKGRLRSEDWAFCDNAIELGYGVYGDTKVVLRHMGNCFYPLESQVQVDRVCKAIQKLQHEKVKVPTEIFDALFLDPSFNTVSYSVADKRPASEAG